MLQYCDIECHRTANRATLDIYAQSHMYHSINGPAMHERRQLGQVQSL